MFLLAHTKAGKEMADTNLISYALIKLNKTGSMYTKPLERWNAKALTDRKTWANFRQHMIAEFKKITASGAGPTIVQEVYGGAYNMTETADDGDSLVESIVHYTDRATEPRAR